MQSSIIDKFYQDIAVKSSDKVHYDKLHFNIEQYKKKVPQGKSQFQNLDSVKQCLHLLKHNAMASLPDLLEMFESNFTHRGGKVFWADTAEDAVAHVIHICQKHEATSVVKSKSMVSEEIELNYALSQFGIDSVETDLGEFIQQLQGEPPYHILTPAMHKSKEDVSELYEREFGLPPHSTPQEITAVTRHLLRQKFLTAKVGITGANFIVANTGSVVITENEGNARMSTTFPEAHIVIVGIEKMIERIEDLSIFLPMLATHGTGQRLTSYNTVFGGDPLETEDGRTKQTYVILLNNGRTNLLADADAYQSLFCIRCGACLNACPVYKTIGGHAYGTTYSGPIGAVISPHLRSMEKYGHLSFASSLCGACTEVCPVKIPIHNLLMSNRQKMMREFPDDSVSQWQTWNRLMKNRWLIDITPNWLKTRMLTKYAKRYAGTSQVLLNPLAKQSFHSIFNKIKIK